MKLSIFTTITKPHGRGDNSADAIECYHDLADEVILVDGGMPSYMDNTRTHDSQPPLNKIEFVNNQWPQEFNWPFIGQQFQRGYEACTGDWVIHADIDFIFHEQDFAAIRKAMEDNPDAPALSFYKYQFILPDRYNLKSRLVLAVNKGKYGDRIRFDSGGDLCQPSLDGKYISPDDVPETGVPFYNYEKLSKTKEQIKDDVERMDRAYHRHFKRWLYSEEGRSGQAYNGWIRMATGRFTKPQKHIAITDHPKYIQKAILNLRPDQWGFNGLNKLEVNDYMRGALK